ncbi:MAG: FapA family protein [Treponema sp.]|nr:FapA family protein [Treponema sp.]
MVTLDKLRLEMESQLEVDKEIHSVEVRADTIEECLADASVQLETKIANLEYEVLEKGFQGIAGLAKKPWKLLIYENPKFMQKKKIAKQAQLAMEEAAEENKIVNSDGRFYIRHFKDGIYLHVVLPVGEGLPVAANDAISASKRPDTDEVDEALIKKCCKEGTDGEYVKIGEYARAAAGDAVMAVDIDKDEMYATISVSPPSMSGAEISANDIIRALESQGVVAGINEEKIAEFVDNPVYHIPYEVATAIAPVNGSDAYMKYNFETDRSKLKIKESETGQMDFKELNLIQNVVEGQPLAQKIQPQRGKGGKTVMGRYLEATNGKDIQIPLGQNVKLDSDGVTVLAACNGEVLIVSGKICVEPVKEVKGVNIKTGNVTYFGTVIVHGNVEDGYNIKADGNIEIYGSVGNCRIESGGDIVISQGIMGRDEGVVSTPKSVWARFIQNAKVEAGENIVVNDNIMNSQVSAMKKIVVRGKRAQIIGGHLFATEEITAKNIGSPAGGTETILEVGFDPKSKARLLELQEQQASLVKELEEVDKNIETLENQKKVRRSLPVEKEQTLSQFLTRKNEITEQTNQMTEEINDLEKRLRELKVVGKVNASGTVYAGSKIYVRDEKDEVKADCKSVTFYYENGFVRRGKFDPSQAANDIKAPDGYSSN